MSTFQLVARPHTNSANHGAAYDISSTPDAPVRGHVFVDVTDHFICVDGHPEPRPALLFRFFGLTVTDHVLGNPSCLVEFHPNWAAVSTGVALLSLGEPGHLRIRLGQRVTIFPPPVTELLCELLTTTTQDLLTDLRVARHRYEVAERHRHRAGLAHEQAQIHEQLTYQAFQDARAICDAAHALLQATTENRSS